MRKNATIAAALLIVSVPAGLWLGSRVASAWPRPAPATSDIPPPRIEIHIPEAGGPKKPGRRPRADNNGQDTSYCRLFVKYEKESDGFTIVVEPNMWWGCNMPDFLRPARVLVEIGYESKDGRESDRRTLDLGPTSGDCPGFRYDTPIRRRYKVPKGKYRYTVKSGDIMNGGWVSLD